MRKFSRLSVVLSHEGNDESDFSAPVVEMTNGSNTVQVSDLESALSMLPPGSEVSVVATGTVGNRTVHNIARIIREGCVLVSLDLSSATELSRVFDSPFRENRNLVGIVFPSNLISISAHALENCENLESVVIPASVHAIGENAFSGCEKLSSLKFGDPKGWFAVCDGNECHSSANLENPEDNPYRFILQSSPYRNCMLEKRS